MPFTKRADGGLYWDDEVARREGRWSSRSRQVNAQRCAWVEMAEGIIERGAIERIWDTLMNPACRPASITIEDECQIVRHALIKGAELRRLDAAMVTVLLGLIPGDDRLRGENKNWEAHRAIRKALLDDPNISNRRLAQEHKVARSTVKNIRDDLFAPADD